MDTSNQVMTSYLFEIHNLYEDFILLISKKCPAELRLELFKIYHEIIIKNHNVYSFPTNNRNQHVLSFKINLLQKLIFKDISHSIPASSNDLYDIFITLENNILQFVKTYFCTFSYIKHINIINSIILEKEYIIKSLIELKSA